MSKFKNFAIKSLKAMKNEMVVLCLIVAIMVTVPISLALATTSIQSSPEPGAINAPIEAAATTIQFHVNLAYAYVGPAPSSVSSYFENAANTTMYLASQYPSVVRLNIASLPGIQITGCDAVIEVYGIKIATDTGPAEYHAYFMGTNYNPSFPNDSRSTLINYVDNLVNINRYSTVAGNFITNWTDNSQFLTNTIGSITQYTSSSNSALGLFNSGKPNAVSVTIYRIGYLTMTNGSVSVFEDPSNNTLTSTVQLSNYESGFLYNSLMPSNKLPQANLFQPTG